MQPATPRATRRPEHATRLRGDAYTLTPAAENSRTYRGSVVTVLLGGASTRGRTAVAEYRARPGSEPPPHSHEDG